MIVGSVAEAHLQLHLSDLCLLTHDVQQCVHLQASSSQGLLQQVIMLQYKDRHGIMHLEDSPESMLDRTCCVLRPLPSSSSSNSGSSSSVEPSSDSVSSTDEHEIKR